MNNIKPVAWINKDLNYVELSTPSTVYGSHTIPLYTNTAVDSITLELEQQLDVAREFCRQCQMENKKLKAATTECYEKNLDLNLENFELKAKKDHLQFLLDSIMLEHCPDEMTEEQMENWKNAQRVVDKTTSVDTADPNYYKSDTYKNNIKYSVDMIK